MGPIKNILTRCRYAPTGIGRAFQTDPGLSDTTLYAALMISTELLYTT